MTTEQIPAALDGERIDRVVAMLTGCTRAESAAALTAGIVTVNGKVVTKPSTKVRLDQIVTVDGDPHTEEELPHADASIEVPVIYADDDIIIIDKPAGMIVHPGAGHRELTLVNGLLAMFPELEGVGERHRPGIVHRLDKGTSGLMVVARTQDAYEDLVDQLATHAVEREYESLVWGTVEPATGTIDAPVGRSRRNPLLMTVSTDGRFARTHYEVIEHLNDPYVMTLLRIRLETGRTHQIRVHLRSIGHPVVGDDSYGGQRPLLDLPRPYLHARRLMFTHPRSGEPVTFESPLAADLVAIAGAMSWIDDAPLDSYPDPFAGFDEHGESLDED
ncbi:MAG: RluA family pseudouridine synthase [Actinobacteria bacterium]|nr:RluA family pseudouridine synthase [Actinomycetota bacterium]